MTKPNTTSESNVIRERLIQKLNTDLASEYQAIVAFIVYSEILKRTAYGGIAQELELHAAEDFKHAKDIANQIDCLGGTPCVSFSPVTTPNEPTAMLLSSIVRSREYQIDMAPLLGIDASLSDHFAPENSSKALQTRSQRTVTGSAQSSHRDSKRDSAKPAARNKRASRMLVPV